MKAPKLYCLEYSPPVRSVLLTAKAIDLRLEIQTVDLGKQEQLSEEFLAIKELSRIGGNTVKELSRKILYRLMTNEVGTKYSWDGAKKKKPFKVLSLAQIIISSTRKCFPQVTDAEVINFIRLWLVRAKDRALNQEKKNNKNPQHTVPTLEESDGFILWDSHAIMPYIVEKYAVDDTFYKKDLKTRATIHQRLHFDTLSGIVRSEAINPLFHDGATSIPKHMVETIIGHYSILEKFLERTEWIAGNTVTIADFSLIPSISTSNIIVPVDGNTFPKLVNWMRKAESWEYYDENKRGHEALKILILERLDH